MDSCAELQVSPFAVTYRAKALIGCTSLRSVVRANAGFFPFGFAQGQNDNQKGNRVSRIARNGRKARM